MKKFATMFTAALMVLSFATVVLAEEKKEDKPAAEAKTVKKDAKKSVKKDKKKGVKEEAKPAAKGKKEVSGC